MIQFAPCQVLLSKRVRHLYKIILPPYIGLVKGQVLAYHSSSGAKVMLKVLYPSFLQTSRVTLSPTFLLVIISFNCSGDSTGLRSISRIMSLDFRPALCAGLSGFTW